MLSHVQKLNNAHGKTLGRRSEDCEGGLRAELYTSGPRANGDHTPAQLETIKQPHLFISSSIPVASSHCTSQGFYVLQLGVCIFTQSKFLFLTPCSFHTVSSLCLPPSDCFLIILAPPLHISGREGPLHSPITTVNSRSTDEPFSLACLPGRMRE